MSMTCSTACVDCRAWAPEVGFGGYLGVPSLSAERLSDDPEELPFGFLYEPLEKLGLRTYDLEAFKAFLIRHNGHRVYTFGDSIPVEFKEMALVDSTEAPTQREELVDDADFEELFYQLECLSCGETYRAPDEAWLRSFDRRDIPQHTIDLYLERLGSLCPDDGWNYRLEPVVNPYLEFIEHLPDFLKAHRSHHVQAKLVR